MTKNIGKLYEAFDAFTNKDFDAAEDMLHEFLVLSAKEQLKESWEVSEDSYFEEEEDEVNGEEFASDDEFASADSDEIGGDMDDDFIGDVSDVVADEEEAPATQQDVMDITDHIDALVAKFEEETGADAWLSFFDGWGDADTWYIDDVSVKQVTKRIERFG